MIRDISPLSPLFTGDFTLVSAFVGNELRQESEKVKRQSSLSQEKNRKIHDTFIILCMKEHQLPFHPFHLTRIILDESRDWQSEIYPCKCDVCEMFRWGMAG